MQTFSVNSCCKAMSLSQPVWMTKPRLTEDCTDKQEAKNMVNEVLMSKPGGAKIMFEYSKTQTLSDSTRRQLVNMLVADMIEVYGRAPPQTVRTKYALGIVSVFPYLEDPYSKNGYEHFYDASSGTGYLAWRLKTVQRNTHIGEKHRPESPDTSSGPLSEREPFSTTEQLTGDEYREAISVMKHTSDERVVTEKMKATFQYRQSMARNPQMSQEVLDLFPRFLDTPGLIKQDFSMLFGEVISEKFLAKWSTFFKPKVINEAKGLSPNYLIEELIRDAQYESDDDSTGWDSDISALLLLLCLLPPTSKGQRKGGKISPLQAADHLVRFLKFFCIFQKGTSIPAFLESFGSAQPFLLCVGENKKSIQRFFVIVDMKAIPCKAQTSVGAFDELFKAHFVFSTSYSESLSSFYTFIQTAIYNIDAGTSKERPRVRELRARFLSGKN
ncbi:uncharacterized protein [Misgurnus anguillicaudatus]|uniref:uncharacterized protein isoform X3 n=1 Tax=Misgurnus anguillicaudatus TaxID=75329 RepID=UPI002434DDFD|nr:uncharacterized protein LOC129440676 isoform X3 [Misgurnus anguillicaudatus]